MNGTLIHYISSLTQLKCSLCGKPKKRGMSFCYDCFKQLPNNMQKNLYKKIGNGYEDAYDQAIKYFRRKGSDNAP